MPAPRLPGIALLAALAAARQNFISLMIVGRTPAGDFRDGAMAADADVAVIKTAIAYAGALHCVGQTVYFCHRSAALSSVIRASTQRPPCGVISFFQNGAWVFR